MRAKLQDAMVEIGQGRRNDDTMNQQRARVRRAGLIVLLVGFVSLVPGLVALGQDLAFAVRAQRVEAVFDAAALRNSSYGLMYYPEFTYRTKDGQELTYKSSLGSSDQEYSKGDRITVLYDPAQPDHVEADSLFGVWLPPVLMLPPAFLVVLIGAAILGFTKR